MTKSISAETTFADDKRDPEALLARLWPLCETVSARLKKNGYLARTVTLKLKTADFKIRTRNRHLSAPTQLADRIFSNGLSLLKNETDGTKYRLIGIGISDLCDPATADPPDLVDPGAAKRAAAEGAIDRLRGKYGLAAVETGYTFRPDRGKSGKDG